MFGAGSWGLTLRTARLLCKPFSNVAEFTTVLNFGHLQMHFLIFFVGAIMLLSDSTVWMLYGMPWLVKLDDEPPKPGPKHAVVSVLLFKASKISRIAPENAAPLKVW